jgi:hypothetical protein
MEGDWSSEFKGQGLPAEAGRGGKEKKKKDVIAEAVKGTGVYLMVSYILSSLPAVTCIR